MITKPTVLILGAGASKPYGFPTGGELKAWMLRNDYPYAALNVLERLPFRREQPITAEVIERFQEALLGSQLPSPDAFLEYRPEFLQLGKYLIAYYLIGCETQENLYRQEDWYTYLLNNKLAASFDDFRRNRISIITFNYDRSLEHFLFRALKHQSGKSDEEVASILQRIPIVHVHGQLARLPWDRHEESSTSERPYADDLARESVLAASNGIKIMSEDIDDTREFRRARRLLEGARRVYFLGFGYHEANMRRLGIPRKDGIQMYPWHAHITGGTRFGLKDAEVNQIVEEFPMTFKPNEHIEILEYLRTEDAFLSEK